MSDFVEEMMLEMQKTMIRQIKDAKFVDSWNQRKHQIPEDVVERVWNNIDWDKVVETVSRDMTDRLAGTIAQAMMTEAKTDAKAVLSIAGVRSKIRAEAYPKILEAIENAK